MQLLSAEGSGNRWLLIDRCLISNPFYLDTIYTETSIQLRTDKFNNLEAAVSCFNLFLIWSWIYGFAWFSPPYKTCQLFCASVYLKSRPGRYWTFGSCCMFRQHQLYVCLATWSGEHTWWASLLSSSNQPLRLIPYKSLKIEQLVFSALS